MFDILIVGTGPSALGFLTGCDLAKKIAVVDTGIEYKKSVFDSSLVDLYSLHDINSKTKFGSTLATDPIHSKIKKNKVTNSFIRGGLSNIWGGVCDFDLSVAESITGGCQSELAKSHEEILKILPVKKAESQLVKYLNSKFEDVPDCRASFVAVDELKCTQCGLCFYGCSEDAIFNSWTVIETMIRASNIEHYDGFLVEAVISNERSAAVVVKNLKTNSISLIESKSVILCTGAINTAEILLNSSIVDMALIKDSAYYAYPFFCSLETSKKGVKLSEYQLSSEIDGLKIKTQIYSPSIYITNQIIKSLKIKWISRIMSFLVDKVGVAQFWLPSQVSGGAVLTRDDQGEVEMVKFDVKNEFIKKYKKKINELLSGGRLHAVLFNLIKFDVFKGYHFGASEFFNRYSKVEINYETGALSVAPHLYIADSTCLKYIPSFSPTLTVMVNANRISRALCKKLF